MTSRSTCPRLPVEVISSGGDTTTSAPVFARTAARDRNNGSFIPTRRTRCICFFAPQATKDAAVQKDDGRTTGTAAKLLGKNTLNQVAQLSDGDLRFLRPAFDGCGVARLGASHIVQIAKHFRKIGGLVQESFAHCVLWPLGIPHSHAFTRSLCNASNYGRTCDTFRADSGVGRSACVKSPSGGHSIT